MIQAQRCTLVRLHEQGIVSPRHQARPTSSSTRKNGRVFIKLTRPGPERMRPTPTISASRVVAPRSAPWTTCRPNRHAIAALAERPAATFTCSAAPGSTCSPTRRAFPSRRLSPSRNRLETWRVALPDVRDFQPRRAWAPWKPNPELGYSSGNRLTATRRRPTCSTICCRSIPWRRSQTQEATQRRGRNRPDGDARGPCAAPVSPAETREPLTLQPGDRQRGIEARRLGSRRSGGGCGAPGRRVLSPLPLRRHRRNHQTTTPAARSLSHRRPPPSPPMQSTLVTPPMADRPACHR